MHPKIGSYNRAVVVKTLEGKKAVSFWECPVVWYAGLCWWQYIQILLLFSQSVCDECIDSFKAFKALLFVISNTFIHIEQLWETDCMQTTATRTRKSFQEFKANEHWRSCMISAYNINFDQDVSVSLQLLAPLPWMMTGLRWRLLQRLVNVTTDPL